MAALTTLVYVDGLSEWRFASVNVDYDIRPIVGKGLGVVARRQLTVGERVLAEKPLARLAHAYNSIDKAQSEVTAAISKLPEDKRTTFFKLSQMGSGPRTVMGIWLNNALPIAYDDPSGGLVGSTGASSEEAAIFATICRINHSVCAPLSQAP